MILPRHVVCILGTWRDLNEVAAIVREFSGFELDREFSQQLPDNRMMNSFDASYDRVTPSMKEEDWQAVKGHTAVAYILSPPLPKDKWEEISGLTLLLTAKLLRDGGVAAKGESAGIAHDREYWLNLAAEYSKALDEGDSHKVGAILYWAWVRRPIKDAAVFYSCGMHLLGKPDIEIESTLDLGAALQWMDLLGLYQVGDRPTRPLKDGEGFRLTNDGPRRIIQLWPCERYEDDSFMFNPYGYIRLAPEV